MQGGYTKYPCYLCLWDSSADALHYKQHSWPKRIMSRMKRLWRPITFWCLCCRQVWGSMKQFVKALRKDSEYFKRFFPKLSEAKVKAGIFVVPQIKKVIPSEEFPELLSIHEKQAWLSLKAVFHGFLVNKKAANYKELISNMLDNFELMVCRMSLKVHMLHAHLDQFKDSLGAY